MKMNDTTQNPRIIFMGTPDFAVPSLRALIEHDYDVIAVVTQPDRPKGRKRILTPPPVKLEAERLGIPVLQPEKLRRPESLQPILELAPDLIVTAAYGQILPKTLLEAPKYRCINVHASLLPRYRGGAPIHRAIINGETVTGVTIMYMAEGLDTGDMIRSVEVNIEPHDNTGTLHDKLSEAGAKLLIQTLPDLLSGQVVAVPQDEAEATYALNITRDDEWIDWSRSAQEIYNQIRGLCPWPVAYTSWNQANLKIWQAQLESPLSGESADAQSTSADQSDAVPGTVLRMTANGIEVLTGDGTIWLTMIQPAGKKAMPVSEFSRGSSIPEGTVLGV